MPDLPTLLLCTLSALSIAPARFSWPQARELERRAHPQTQTDLALVLREAERTGDRQRAAAAAAELCGRGNPGAHACAAAERTAGALARRAQLMAGKS